MMTLMDVVMRISMLELQTREPSRQQFEAATRCSWQHQEAAEQISMLVETVAKRITKREQEADIKMISQQLVADIGISWQREADITNSWQQEMNTMNSWQQEMDEETSKLAEATIMS